MLQRPVEAFGAKQPAQANERPRTERHQVTKQYQQSVSLHYACGQEYHGPSRDRVGEWYRDRQRKE